MDEQRIYVSEPEELHETFVARAREFGTAGSSTFKALIGDQALIFLSGKPHLEARKLLGPPFLGARMREFGPVIEEITRTVLARVPKDTPVPVIGMTRDITLRLMLRFVFGPIEAEDAVVRLCSDLVDAVHGKGGDPVRLQAELDDFVTAQSVGHHDSADVLGHLLRAESLTAEQIRVHVVTLLIAGYESTSSALAWATYLVHQHPGVLARINEPGYLDAVCDEVLRYASIVPTGIARTVPGEDTELVPCIHAAHRRPEAFADPDRFAPDRFLGGRFSPTEYLPFGIGPRRCLGAVFAAYEMRIALATMLATPGFRVHPTEREVPAEVQGPTLTLPETVLAELASVDDAGKLVAELR
ncbi:cytochrome P450 [Lentzea sp. NPDC051213]|uniref:cytochrome P450 n=1 Tax=Lentzea sp. NPDC051213 TaxID=3364126 RepID=UPI0037AC87C4